MATCAYEPCSQTFTPKRTTQKFHHPSCRLAFWHQHHHGGVHKCPLCGALHDAEEATVLDALEMLLASCAIIIEPDPRLDGYTAETVRREIEAFITRRRAISAP